MESSLWRSFKRQLEKDDEVHIDRIENSLGSGTPDVMLCRRGVYAFVELKKSRNPLRPNQKVWHRRHRRRGGRVFILRGNDIGTIDLITPEEEKITYKKPIKWKAIIERIFKDEYKN